ncbi:CBS domain-containing protein [Pelagibacterium limicola]|uniref:CBS domain-containing protein n=1 Tax=Pelagibacterium limicola TaxID=2791022 RepID=UPI0018AF5DAA|nr:CBS domain-containing protein [Pelagibacterium limicola]
MRVRDLMTRDVQLIGPQDSLREAARLMADHDIGFLPVTDGERLVGTLTDRDIAIRAVCLGKSPETGVGEAMTDDVKYCFDEDDIAEVTANMADIQVRRLPVVDSNKRLVGVLALADVAIEGSLYEEAADALSGISRHDGNGRADQWQGA